MSFSSHPLDIRPIRSVLPHDLLEGYVPPSNCEESACCDDESDHREGERESSHVLRGLAVRQEPLAVVIDSSEDELEDEVEEGGMEVEETEQCEDDEDDCEDDLVDEGDDFPTDEADHGEEADAEVVETVEGAGSLIGSQSARAEKEEGTILEPKGMIVEGVYWEYFEMVALKALTRRATSRFRFPSLSIVVAISPLTFVLSSVSI